MSELNSYFDYAQLSQAAYANFTTYDRNAVQLALEVANTADFADAQAGAFTDPAQGYTVLSQSPANLNGFSATLFLDNATGQKILAVRGTNDPADLFITDLLIGTLGLDAQYASLKTYYQQLIAEGKLGASETFSVVGHSLGGFLAQAFAVDYSSQVTQTYTYNAPGFGGVVAEILNKLGVTASNIPVANITNLFAQPGANLASGWGTLVGQVRPLFIEQQATDLANHDIKYLTDALAVYNLFSTIDPNAQVTTVTDILKASSYTTLTRDPSDLSLENALDSLRTLFQQNYANSTVSTNATPTTPDNRDSFYTNLLSLQTYLKNSPFYNTTTQSLGFTVDKLTSMGASTLTANAQADIAYRYALYKLNPFVVNNAGTLYNTLNTDHSLDRYDSSTRTGALTDEYLKDRSALLYNKLVAATNNSIYSDLIPVPYVAGGSLQVFEDKTTNYQLYTGDPYAVGITPLNNFNQIRFGSAQGESITGGDTWDKLYGMAGNDTLQGNKGSDYLEGEPGTDTYIYSSGDGTDTLLDTDHQGQIKYDGLILNGGKQVSPNTYRSQDGKFIYTLIPGLGTPNLLSLTGPGGNILIEDFTSGDLGINLNPADPLPPAQNIIYGDQSQPGYYDNLDAAPATQAIYGLGGNDVLSGHAGKNGYVPTIQLYGGAGNDIIYGEYFYTSEYYRLGPTAFQTQYGTDVTLTGPGSYLQGEAGNDTLLGSLLDDTLNGGADPDYLQGYLGNDTLIGGTGNDIENGNEGRDVLQGDDGIDRLGGGAGADVLQGGADADILYGDSTWFQPVPWDGTNYTLPTGTLSTLSIPLVKDVADTDAGADVLLGGAGDDKLFGGAGNDLLDGGLDADQLQGEGGDDILYGGDGNDKLWGDSSADAVTNDAQIVAVAGTYTYYYRERHVGMDGNDTLDGGAGDDQLWGGGGNDTLLGGTGSDWLMGGLGDGSASGNDLLEGGDGIDYLFGEDGNDILHGGAGDDFLYGGPGADTLDGGPGNDDIYLDGQDKVILDGADFLHKVDGTTPVDLSQGFTVDYAPGNIAQAQINQVTGSDGRQWLRVAFDATNILYLQNGFLDDGQIFDFGADNLSQQQLMQYAPAVNLTGTEGNDKIYGSNNNDTLSGAAGDDLLDGQGGDDLYIVDSPHDIAAESPGKGTDTVQASVSYSLGANIENLILTGTGPLSGAGNAGNNVITGNAGDNTLSGGAGDDTLMMKQAA